MFDVTLTNNSSATLATSDGKKVDPAGTWKWSSHKGAGDSAYIDGPFGRVGFLDIGDTHIGGDSTETWGVLIRYADMAVVGRYDGQGTLDFDVDQFLQIGLEGMDFRQVMLEALVLPNQVPAAAD